MHCSTVAAEAEITDSVCAQVGRALTRSDCYCVRTLASEQVVWRWRTLYNLRGTSPILSRPRPTRARAERWSAMPRARSCALRFLLRGSPRTLYEIITVFLPSLLPLCQRMRPSRSKLLLPSASGVQRWVAFLRLICITLFHPSVHIIEDVAAPAKHWHHNIRERSPPILLELPLAAVEKYPLTASDVEVMNNDLAIVCVPHPYLLVSELDKLRIITCIVAFTMGTWRYC